MALPSTTLRPAGIPSLAECASRFQCAVPNTCQIPFRSGLRSGVRGPWYAEALSAAEAGDRVAPRCAGAAPAASIVINTGRPATPATAAIGFFILTCESLPQPGHPRNAAADGAGGTRKVNLYHAPAVPDPLFVSQRDRGIDGRRPPRGDIRGHQRNHRQNA